jgi:hypothetical protein
MSDSNDANAVFIPDLKIHNVGKFMNAQPAKPWTVQSPLQGVFSNLLKCSVKSDNESISDPRGLTAIPSGGSLQFSKREAVEDYFKAHRISQEFFYFRPGNASRWVLVHFVTAAL